MARFCSKCGTPLNAGMKFCKNCGSATDGIAAQAQQAKHAMPGPQPTQPVLAMQVQQAKPPTVTGGTQPVGQAVFCSQCGGALKPGAKFCRTCGAKSVASAVVQQATHAVAQFTASKVTASPMAGEVAIGGFSALPSLPPVLGPATVLVNGFRSIATGFAGALKNPKALIPAIILAVTWIVLTLLPMLGIDALPVQLAQALTFAQGGLSGNPLDMVGGLFGKGLFATVFVSLFSGGVPSIANGARNLVSAFKGKTINRIAWMALGVGAALIAYNFFAGYASLWQSMAGVSGLLLSLKALGSNNSFTRKMVASITAQKAFGGNGETLNVAALNQVLAGLTAGFALALALSAIPWGYTPYVVGGVVLVTGLALVFVTRRVQTQHQGGW